MPQSLAQVYLHLVWSTKHRHPFLSDKEQREKMHAYLAGTCHNLKCPSLIVGGVEDHIHILCRLARTITIADLIRDLKRASSGWVKSLSPRLKEFDWQDGYGAFSISPSHVTELTEYIRDQENHHLPRVVSGRISPPDAKVRHRVRRAICVGLWRPGSSATAVLYPEGITAQSPASRSARRVAGTN